MDSESVDDVLAHYGVKGMKWGVRKDRSGSSQGPLAKRKAKRAEAKAQKQADKATPKSEDAVKAKTAQRKARNAGTDVLSNQELQALVTRMNLEQQYTRLAGDPQKSAGREFAKTLYDAELKAIKSGKAGPIQVGIETGKRVQKVFDKKP